MFAQNQEEMDKKQEITPGALVMHKEFEAWGEGEVMEIRGNSGVALVKFPPTPTLEEAVEEVEISKLRIANK